MRMEMVFDIKYIWKFLLATRIRINMTWIQYKPLHIHFDCEFHLFYGVLHFFFSFWFKYIYTHTLSVCFLYSSLSAAIHFSLLAFGFLFYGPRTEWNDHMNMDMSIWLCECRAMWNENVNRQEFEAIDSKEKKSQCMSNTPKKRTSTTHKRFAKWNKNKRN